MFNKKREKTKKEEKKKKEKITKPLCKVLSMSSAIVTSLAFLFGVCKNKLTIKRVINGGFHEDKYGSQQ